LAFRVWYVDQVGECSRVGGGEWVVGVGEDAEHVAGSVDLFGAFVDVVLGGYAVEGWEAEVVGAPPKVALAAGVRSCVQKAGECRKFVPTFVVALEGEGACGRDDPAEAVGGQDDLVSVDVAVRAWGQVSVIAGDEFGYGPFGVARWSERVSGSGEEAGQIPVQPEGALVAERRAADGEGEQHRAKGG
jgi:hypothetical protein